LEATPETAAVASARQALWPGWLPLISFPAITIVFRNRVPAWEFMWTLSFAIFLGLKWVTWWEVRNHVPYSAGRSLAYSLGWPGMDAESFLDPRQHSPLPRFGEWLWAAVKTIVGMLLLWAVARAVPASQMLARGWIGLFGLIFLLHFGSFHLIALFWQTVGIAAQPIMSQPVLSKTLSEFWGKRWNLGFRQLAYDLIFRPLHKRIGVPSASLLVFLASGLIHDLVISLRPWRLRPAHCLLSSAGLRRFCRTLKSGPAARIATRFRWLAIYVRRRCRSGVLALSSCVCPARHTSLHVRHSCLMTNYSAEHFFDLALWLAGLGHFVILFASFQVPSRLRWKEDLAQLMPLNRKLLWVQSSFTVLTIIAFGTLTLTLHEELLRGDRAALELACFIATYWTARILVDAFYFSHEDWPKGKQFVIGHFLLTTLFVALAGSYWGLFVWQLWLRARS
jgi:alginate O-acetyltransferase complex protein AlgI